MSMSFDRPECSTEQLRSCSEMLDAFASDASLAFTRLRVEDACAEARAVDALRARGAMSLPLQGQVFGVKACFDVQGWVNHAGSKVLADSAAATADAPLVARLREAGAVLLGHNNMTEFAYGALGQNSTYGTPLCTTLADQARVSGGSSSGGAVAVSRGMQTFALGSDTSGSVRIPAAFCGVVGFKPSKHRYADGGMQKLSTSFDVPGFIARDVATCIQLDKVAALPLPQRAAEQCQTPLLLVPAHMLELLDEKVRSAFEQVMAYLQQSGYTVEVRELKSWQRAPGVARTGGIIAAEAFVAHQACLQTSLAAYDPKVGPRILAGQQVLAAHYLSACQELEQLRNAFTAELGDAALVLSPTVPMPPPTVQELEDLERYLALNARSFALTEPANRLDLPSISLPLPEPFAWMGILLTGQNQADEQLLAWALQLESQLKTIAISNT
ncbi:amidase family protein [Comamonas sp. J-3]|uniref:amidase family protein n=1 Tax=Comamonas trifloxystrobinivorans TaxID=3350256 RepID=UPI00372AD558